MRSDLRPHERDMAAIYDAISATEWTPTGRITLRTGMLLRRVRRLLPTLLEQGKIERTTQAGFEYYRQVPDGRPRPWQEPPTV